MKHLAVLLVTLSSVSAGIIDEGKAAWNDKSLSTNGTKCMTCHVNNAMLDFKPFPKHIKMAKKKLNLTQMINFCIKRPLKGKPIGPKSRKMKAMKAYYHKLKTAAGK